MASLWVSRICKLLMFIRSAIQGARGSRCLWDWLGLFALALAQGFLPLLASAGWRARAGALRRVVLLFLFVFCLLPAIFLRGSTVAACSLAENSKGAGIKRGVVLSWVVSGSCGVEVCCVVHRLCSSCSVLPAQKTWRSAEVKMPPSQKRRQWR